MSTNGQRPRILQITACAVPGEKRTFVNIYGLSDAGTVWQWNAKLGDWEPHLIPEKQDRREGAFR